MKSIKLFLSSFIIIIFLFNSLPAQSSESLMRSGIRLLRNGAFDQAVSKFRKVVSRDPSDFEAQYNLAFAYLGWGRNSIAVKEFKKAINLNSKSAEAWSNLAVAYQNLGQPGNAINAMYKAVESNPNNIQARINLATVYAKKHRISDAINQYKQVIKIDGENLDAHVNLAHCLVSLNKPKEARYYLDKAITIDPNAAEAYYELGNLLWKKEKNVTDAIKNYRKAVTLKPNSQVYYENLGLLLEDQWKKKNDEKLKQEAIDLWKKWLVYLDDALKKEEIRERLAMLEKGESLTGSASIEELFGQDRKKEDFEKLRKEMRQGQGVDTSSVKIISTEGLNLNDDLNDLEQESENKFDFNLDEAVEKKKKEKKDN